MSLPRHIFNDLTQYFSDRQWLENREELFRLAYRRLSQYLSPQDQEILRYELFIAGGNLAEQGAPVASEIPDNADDVNTDAMEARIQLIFQKFGVENVGQLVRWAVFSSEEEIATYLAS